MADNLIESRRKIILNSPHIASASGSIVSVNDAIKAKLKSCVIDINPVQSGTGDPSPDNVRPISGWEGCNVSRTGKNLADLPNVTTTQVSYVYTNSPIDLKPGTYTFSAKYSGNNAGAQSSFRVDDKDGNQIYSGSIAIANGVNKKTFTITDTAKAVKWYSQSAGTYTDGMIELGSQATAYEPYTGTTYPISWQSEAGTVYGGTLDVTNGVLRADRSYVDLGDFKWERNNPYQYYSNVLNKTGVSSRLGDTIICSAYKSGDAYSGAGDKKICLAGSTKSRIWIYDRDLGGTAAEVKEAVTGYKCVYELVTPITYQLTPTQINTLLGTNNIWADTGDISVKYWSHP